MDSGCVLFRVGFMIFGCFVDLACCLFNLGSWVLYGCVCLLVLFC
jgi:hypothetical protein